MAQLSLDLSKEVSALSKTFGTVLTDEQYMPDHFGDGILVLTGPIAGFRIVRDKGEIFVDARGLENDWIDVRDTLGGLNLLANPRELHPVGELVKLICNNPNVFRRHK